ARVVLTPPDGPRRPPPRGAPHPHPGPGGKGGGPRGERRRGRRRPRRAPGAHLRAVLHHQGRRQGHRPRALARVQHRARSRRHARRAKRAGRRHHGDAEPAARRGGTLVASILIVEDEPVLRGELKRMLVRSGHQAMEAGSVEEAMRAGALGCDLVLTDLRLPGASGTDLIVRAPGVPVLIMTSYATVKSAVEAMRMGAV